MDYKKLKDRLSEKGLKVTSRRLSLLEAIIKLKHPSAEEILKYIRKKYPDIATATVYKALNVLVENKVIRKVNTDKDIVRYDAVQESHHHLYCSELNRIEDYKDDGLNRILKKYLKNKKIPGFNIEGFNLQIIGKFSDKNRLYTTGQSMGGMMSFYFNATHPDLFAASVFVGSQWDINVLEPLARMKFFYIVSAGDPKASAGMKEIVKEGHDINFVQFTKGTVIPENSKSPGGEHMYSFDYAYQLNLPSHP